MVWFNIISKLSGLAVDASGMQPGNPVIQWSLHNRENQRWKIVPDPGSDSVSIQAYDDETQEYVSLQANADGVDFSGVMNNGLSVCVSVPNESPNQRWYIRGTEPGWCRICPVLDSGKSLDVTNSSQVDGTRLTIWDSHGGSNQQWRLVPTTVSHFSYMGPADMAAYSIPFDDIRTHLLKLVEKNGFAVICNVLDEEASRGLEAALGQDLRGVVDERACRSSLVHSSIDAALKVVEGVDLEDVPRVWPGDHSRPALSASYGIPQGRFAWAARTHPRVRAVYECLHGVESEGGTDPSGAYPLVVGMDPPFFKPTRSVESAHTNMWAHADINVHCTDGGQGDWLVYQSIVSIWPSDSPGASTTVIWPGSHRTVFPYLMVDDAFREDCHHYCRVDKMKNTVLGQPVPVSATARWLNECYLREARRVSLPAGSMLVWDSRTVHQGWDEGRRLAMPVCWEPRERRTDQVLRRKLRIAASGGLSTHWASLGREHSVPRLPGPMPGRIADEDEDDDEAGGYSTGRRFVSVRSRSTPVYVSTAKLPTCLNHLPFVLKAEVVQSPDAAQTIADLCAKLVGSDYSDVVAAEALACLFKPEYLQYL